MPSSVLLPAPFSPTRAWMRPGSKTQIDIVQRGDAWITLRDADQLDDGVAHALFPADQEKALFPERASGNNL